MTNRKNREPSRSAIMSCARREAGLSAIPAAVSSLALGALLLLATTPAAAQTDTTAPAFESAAADGAALVITFDEDLAAAASLANSAFTVEKTPSGGVEETVTLSTTAPVISGKTVTLTLATALVYTDGSVKVSYNKPTAGSANKLADAAGNETASFTDQTVTNNTVASDRAALIALYNATDGANWTDNTNWLSNKALSEWNGVSTDRYDRVTRLYLPQE